MSSTRVTEFCTPFRRITGSDRRTSSLAISNERPAVWYFTKNLWTYEYFNIEDAPKIKKTMTTFDQERQKQKYVQICHYNKCVYVW